jgi:hypothetical protein
MAELVAGVLVEAVGAIIAALLVRLLHRWVGWPSTVGSRTLA